MQTENLKNIGIIEKINVNNDNNMFIYVKLDLTTEDSNIFLLDNNKYELSPISNKIEVDKVLYDLCIAAKIHRSKCNFEVIKEKDNSTFKITAITLL